MNYHFANTAVSPVKPAADSVIFDGDLEKGSIRVIQAAEAVPLRAPHPKVSIPHEPEVPTAAHDLASAPPAPKTTRYTRNRLILCTIIYIVLTFPSTFTVSRKMWLFATNIGDATREPRQLYDKVLSKISAVEGEYEQCPRDQGLQCRLRTSSDEAQERARLDFVHTRVNQVKVDAAQQRQMQCRRSASSVRGTLHELVINGHDLPFVLKNEAICSAETRKAILTTAGADTEADLMDINDYVAQYIERADKSFDAVVDYGHNRAVYDRNYFLGKLVQLIDTIIDQIDDFEVSMNATFTLSGIELRDVFQGFVACVAPQRGSKYVCRVPSVKARIDEIVQVLRNQFDYARMLLRIAFEAIADLVDNYNMLKAALRNFVDVINKLREFFGAAPFDAAWRQINGPDLRRFINLPDGRYFVPGDLDSFPNFGGIPSFDPIWTFFSERANDCLKLLTSIMDRLLAAVRSGLVALKNVIEEYRDQLLLFEDYNPPKFPGANSTDIRGLKVNKKEESLAFLDGVRLRTNGLKTTAAFLPEPNTFVPPTSALDLTNVTSEAREPFSDLLDLHLPKLSPFFLRLLKWANIVFENGRIILVVEYFYLIWHTFNRYKYYMNHSSIPMQEVDLGTSNELAQEKEPEQSHLPCLVSLLFHDMLRIIFLGLCVVVVVFPVVVGCKAYYNHYYERCVIAKEGTDLTTGFIIPAVTNQALIKGDTALGREVKAFKDHHVSLCSKAKSDSFWVQEQQQTKLLTIANDHEQTMADIAPLLACINFDALDGVEPGLYYELRSCMEPIDTTLENGVATCDWSGCDIQCNREEAHVEIKLAVVEPMCEFEYRIQSWVLLCCFMQLQYWCLYFTTGRVLQGCLLRFWKQLRPPTVKLKYDYNVDEGRPVIDKTDLDKATKGAIESHLKDVRNRGYRQFSYAVLLNIPWISSMVYFSYTGADPLKPKWLEG